VGKEHRFGVGSVDEMGIAAKGEAAVGWPCFFMTKVRLFVHVRACWATDVNFVPVGESLIELNVVIWHCHSNS